MDHIKMIETWAVRYEQTKEKQYLELLERSKTALSETLALQNEALFYLNIKDAKQRAILGAIKDLIIQQGEIESNAVYEQIYNMVCRGLENNEAEQITL